MEPTLGSVCVFTRPCACVGFMSQLCGRAVLKCADAHVSCWEKLERMMFIDTSDLPSFTMMKRVVCVRKFRKLVYATQLGQNSESFL